MNEVTGTTRYRAFFASLSSWIVSLTFFSTVAALGWLITAQRKLVAFARFSSNHFLSMSSISINLSILIDLCRVPAIFSVWSRTLISQLPMWTAVKHQSGRGTPICPGSPIRNIVVTLSFSQPIHQKARALSLIRARFCAVRTSPIRDVNTFDAHSNSIRTGRIAVAIDS